MEAKTIQTESIQSEQRQTESIEAKPRILKTTTIGDAITKYPSAIEPLMDTGINCIGCSADTTASVELAAKSIGMTDAQVDDFVAKINQIVDHAEKSFTGNVIDVTDKAAEKIKDILKQQNKADFALRINVMKGGCAGNSYEFKLDKEAGADDNVIEEKGVKIFVNEASLGSIKGSKIDYVDALTGAGFKVSNPNATKSCSCGQSFR